MNIPTISVIVPVYNVEQYLRKCLDSILNQTFIDFELLLINDGSPDTSGQICDEYALKDSRIRVFHKENGGVSSARNLGLDNAKGKWVAFIDSDDWVNNTYFEHLLEGDEDVELRVMGIWIQNYKQRWEKQVTRNELFLTDDLWRFYKLYLLHNSIVIGPMVKLFLLSIINTIHIRFKPYLSYGEDTIFNLQYLKQIKSISMKNYAEYYYRCTENSLCKNNSIDRREKFFMYAKKVIFPLMNDKRLNETINNWLNSICLSRIRHLYLYQNLKTKDRHKYLLRIFDDLNKNSRNNKVVNFVLATKIIKGYPAFMHRFLYHVLIFVADIIFLFFFWIKQKVQKVIKIFYIQRE
jgi:glycosyltransferase involved in cell wall biosynthesis